MIAIAARCGACSVVYPGVQVGTNFRVRVEDLGSPVRGLRVGISDYGGSGNTRVVTNTDKNGFALFHGVRPGSYLLSADHDAGIPDGVDLEVKLDGPTNVTVSLRWPETAPILVHSLKGTIRGPDYLPGQPQPRLSLDLLEGSSGRRLKSLQTTDSGAFNFESAVPGLYFLSLKPSGLWGWSGERITGLVAVAVDRGAPTDDLDIDLAWTSCGLGYVDRSKCPQRDLQIGQLSGQVLDASGAAIRDAKILLFDSNETLVERLQSDSAGKFTSRRSLAGTYALVVSTAGFTPLRRTVHAEPTGDSTRLNVQLGVSGSCSSVDPQ
jgi:hypothetical protein